ncbi:MAG: type II secretion system major pseudopilin GspG [Gammaproteobacteria bacterium]
MLQLGKHDGFTLIEVMVVLVIIGILASLIAPKILGRQQDAMIVKTRADIRTLESALGMYKLDNFSYPSTDQGLEALIQNPGGTPAPRNWRSGGYIDRLPKDPWGNPYQYMSPGTHAEIDIFSLGADGQLGGTEVNADIGNWSLE